MYCCVNKIIDYKLMAKDGEFGKCDDFLFEDRPWIVRYMVADTGGFLNRRKVLIPLMEIEKPDRSARLFHVDLTKEQIEESPPLSEDEPVSRQYERISCLYFGWPAHWAGDDLENTISTPSGVFREPENAKDRGEKESSLRSVTEVTGYHIEATKGRVGKVSDFIVDDNIWAIRYLVVDLQNGVKDKKVLLAPDWVNTVDWLNHTVNVDLSVDGIENCPEFKPEEPFGPDLDSMVSRSNWANEYIRNLEKENLLLKLSVKKYKKQLEYYKLKINMMSNSK
jgi:hypothetical protein